MTPEDALSALAAVGEAMHEQFGAHHTSRLAQLDAALATAAMAVTHLVDEEGREVDLAHRILNRDTVHKGDEVHDPHGRSLEHIRSIAAGKVN